MRLSLVLGAIAATAIGCSTANAAVNLVQNGDFEQTTLTSSQQIVGNTVTGWTNAATSGYTGYGYTFLIFPGTADTTGFYSSQGNHDYLWGPNGGNGTNGTVANYTANGLTPTSPTGGNYILQDGDSGFHGALSQTINNLTVGQVYMLTFYTAAAQFYNFSGNTTESWNVGFGSASQNTPTVSILSHGFSPWQQQTMYFVASATTQVLSFLANGTPAGQPPTNLLDGVFLAAVPEPGSMGLALVGVGAVGFMVWRRRNERNASNAV